MTGGLLQLVAYGAQDIYLTGNPQITYFKTVYRRHTNFAMESIFLAFNSETNFGQMASAIIPRSGDLINGITLEAVLPALPGNDTRWTDDVGHHLLKRVDILIGGQVIDSHYSDWLEIWAQLTVTASHKVGYRQLIGQGQRDVMGQPMGLQRPGGPLGEGHAETRIYVPLQFWFCRNVGLALPLIALQYHEVRLQILFESVGKLALRNGQSIDEPTLLLYPPAQPPIERLHAELWVDYVFLDTDERRRFAQTTHEYLIDQIQYLTLATNTAQTFVPVVLSFNHSVKELLWVWRSDAATNLNQLSNYTNVVTETMITKDNIKESGMPTIITDNEYIMRIPDYFQSQGLWHTQPKAVEPYVHYPLSYSGDDGLSRWSLPNDAIHGLQDNDTLILVILGDPPGPLVGVGPPPTVIGTEFTVQTISEIMFQLYYDGDPVSTDVNSDNWGFFLEAGINSYYYGDDGYWMRVETDNIPHGLQTNDVLIITQLGDTPGDDIVLWTSYYVKVIDVFKFELYADVLLEQLVSPAGVGFGWRGQDVDHILSYNYRLAVGERRWYPRVVEYEDGDIIYLSQMGTQVSTVFELGVPYTITDCQVEGDQQTFLLLDDNDDIVEDLTVTMNNCSGGAAKPEAQPVDGTSPMDSAKLVINGTDRFAQREGGYFNRVQTYRHHTNIPDSPGIYCYSFAVRPEGYQPTGSCNFSRLDTAQMMINMVSNLGAGSLKFYCLTCNVLRIMSGMGGLAYMS